jgi:hypothetical protein
MRLALALPLLLLAAGCSVQKDGGNDQVTIQYNEQRIRDAASEAVQTTRNVGRSVGNVAEGTVGAIRNEVGDIDVDVNVTRNAPGNRQ